MAETGIAEYTTTPGSLDPTAEEFRPRNPTGPNQQLVLFGPPLPLPPPLPQLYYPYGSPYHPPPLPITEVHVLPLGDGGLCYKQSALACVGSAAVHVPVPAMSSAPTRAVLLSSVPSEVSESLVRTELEAFGEVRGVQMERICDGIVTVHFYDLRHAESAVREIRDQHMQHQTMLRNYHFMMTTGTTTATTMSTTTNASITTPLLIRNSGLEDPNWAASLLFPHVPPPAARGLLAGRAVWAQFVIPAINSTPDGFNQGTIVIFNLDSQVTTSTLEDTLQAFGPIKELRETPSKKHQKFIEFFDVRDAAEALKEMNGKEINGKEVVIEFSSRPGDHSRKIINAVTTTAHQRTPSPPLVPSSTATRKLSGASHFNMNIPPRSYAAQAPAQIPLRKSGVGNGNGSNGSTMPSWKLGSCVCGGSDHPHHRERVSHGLPSKRFTRKTQNTTTRASQAPRSKVVSRHGKKFDSWFRISEDTMKDWNCRDTRTTVMIKNIPNKYSQKLLLSMLDSHCIYCNEQIVGGRDQPFSSYDFVYLPIDFNTKCNVGYGFVNMTSPEATWRLYKAFHLQHWKVFNSRKICEVTYARVQGLEALKEHFKNSKFPCETDHYLPAVFTPPRNGRQLTEPLPIVGQSNQPQTLPIDDDDGAGALEKDSNGVFDGSNDDDGVALITNVTSR
ncbi:Splicing factor-like protein [Parasponia andersonii]|uniref:Splicing factor-like protein n=1 Tax=Parasponia andersonii TaxID=3476 RepID=A0A2P5BEN6_PARAD|nr:Splicing factor-like protein [Parasponia andersonii]